jgi:RNA polymerase sigma-70 factor (ECF subfamily)
VTAAGDDETTYRFATACRDGDVVALRGLLAPDAVIITDGGGNVDGVVEAVRGRQHVAGWVAEVLARHPGGCVSIEDVNGRRGVVLRRSGRVMGVASLDVGTDGVRAVWLVLNPSKLQQWPTG